MKGIKKLILSIRDRNLTLQERQFRLLALIGLCGLAAGIIDSIVIGEDIRGIAVMSAAFFFFAGLFFYSIRCHKTQRSVVIMGVAITFFILPYIFLTSGGIYGGSPLWFLFGIFYVCLVVEGKSKYILLSGCFLIDSACYYVAYAYPPLVVWHTPETAYIDSLVSLAIIAVLLCCMILFQNAIYRSENELARKQTQEIEELNRAQNRFFSSMSHEIRTPINTIIGLNEMILREAVSEEVAADAGKIQDASKMLLALINDFLDMSKIQSGKMDILQASYDVGAMLSDIVNMTWVRAKEKGLAFHVDVDQTIPAKLVGDEVRIKQVLINVLNNAVKYTRSGSVTLSVQSKGVQDGCAQVTYTITDTGIGIKKESIPHLFNAFKRLDEENSRHIEGTGLGLSIVKQLLDLMGGDIAVNSVYMRGSTFVITLPQKTACETMIGEFDPVAVRSHDARESYMQSFEAPKARILIVDDNETNLMVAEKLLRETRMQIDTVTNGQACLGKTLQNRYDVILLDHLMPEMDGIECLHAIRVQTGGLNQSTPVVILTANAGEEYRSLYMKEGFDGYLVKPINGKQLETEILRHLPKEIVNIAEEYPVGIVESSVRVHKRRMSVMISTDSVCDLPKVLTGKYQVSVMPYRVCTENGMFLDGVETETRGILAYMGDKGKMAKSEAPAVEDYEEFFAEQLTRAQYIVHIAMAQKVSDGYAHALEASRAFDNVIVIDSGHLSSGMGLMVLQAAKHAKNGMSAAAVVDEISRMKPQIRTSFIVDSTEYLARSGRLTSQFHTLCKALLLHPVLILKNSGMKVRNVMIGAKNHVWKKYIDSMLRDKRMIDTGILFITYAGMTRAELAFIEEQVKKKAEFQEIILQKASPAISANFGPGAFGLIFMTK